VYIIIFTIFIFVLLSLNEEYSIIEFKTCKELIDIDRDWTVLFRVVSDENDIFCCW